MCVLFDEGHLSAAASRYARGRCPWPSGDAARLALLLELASRRGLRGWALDPTHDEAAALVARNAEALAPHFRLTTPPWEVTR